MRKRITIPVSVKKVGINIEHTKKMTAQLAQPMKIHIYTYRVLSTYAKPYVRKSLSDMWNDFDLQQLNKCKSFVVL